MKKGLLLAVVAVLCWAGLAQANSAGSAPAKSPDDVQKTLAIGNQRYAAGSPVYPNLDQRRRMETASQGQHPLATVITCSDSRVPAEAIFDRGIGDIFVIRVAGNVADTDEIATAEYGVDHLGTPLLVVLGHTKCGAVTAVATGAEVHGNLPKLVDNIIPAVQKAKAKNPQATGDALVAEAITMNIWQAIEDMFVHSDVIKGKAKAGSLKVVGALYDIETGKVSWLGSHPREAELLAGAPEKTH